MHSRHAANVHKTGKENESQWRSIVFEENTNRVSEETTGSKFTADISHHE